MDFPILAALRSMNFRANVWPFLSVLLGVAWLVLNFLAFSSPGDHLWQQTLLEYQGHIALICLSLILLAGPLRRGFPGLLEDRRWLGLLAFGFACAHSLGAFQHTLGGTWWAFEFLSPRNQYALWMGVASLLLLLPLALTSTNGAIKRLGKFWRWLHKLVIPSLILAMAHTLLMGVHYPLDKAWGMITATLLLGAGLVVFWLRSQNSKQATPIRPVMVKLGDSWSLPLVQYFLLFIGAALLAMNVLAMFAPGILGLPEAPTQNSLSS
jgi:methionine sulfoxide reductase heme-binding subunit